MTDVTKMISRETLFNILENDDKVDAVLEVLKEEQAAKNRAANNVRYTMAAFPEGKLNPQVKALCDTAVSLTSDDQSFTMAELGRAAVESKRLETKQEPDRVAAFYRKKLMELGMVVAEEHNDDAAENA